MGQSQDLQMMEKDASCFWGSGAKFIRLSMTAREAGAVGIPRNSMTSRTYEDARYQQLEYE